MIVWLALLLVIQKSGAQVFVNVGGELSGCASLVICQDSTFSYSSDLIAGYAPPGFFAATPVVPAYKIRERFFGIDLDKHAAEVAKAYAYASQTSNGIVKDGLSVSTMQASPWICHNQIIASGDVCLNGYVLLQFDGYTVDDTAHVQSFGMSGSLFHMHYIPLKLGLTPRVSAGGQNRGSYGRNDTLLQRFHSVTLEETVSWDAQSTKINEQRPFDDVASRKYYAGMRQIGTSVVVCTLSPKDACKMFMHA